MSLFKNNKNRNKVVNPYCSLGWLHDLSEVCQAQASLGASWQTEQHYYFFLLFIFLTKKWTSAVCGGGGVRAHPSHPPPYGPGYVQIQNPCAKIPKFI